MRLAPRQQILRARFAARVLHAHGLVVRKAVDVARPAVAKLALGTENGENMGKWLGNGGGMGIFFFRCYVLVEVGNSW